MYEKYLRINNHTAMPKYNITEKKQKSPLYRSMLSQTMVEDLYQKIMAKFIIEKKHRDPNYSAQKMAEELDTNTRYISAVVNLRYQDNYSQMVNEFRIKEAMYMLADIHCQKMTMEDIGMKVGFSNRQCFYAAFYKRLGMSPNEYKKRQLAMIGDSKKSRKSKAKKEVKKDD